MRTGLVLCWLHRLHGRDAYLSAGNLLQSSRDACTSACAHGNPLKPCPALPWLPHLAAAAKRRPQKASAYAQCRRAGLGEAVRGMGLSAEQFGENVDATYKRHEPKDPDVSWWLGPVDAALAGWLDSIPLCAAAAPAFYPRPACCPCPPLLPLNLPLLAPILQVLPEEYAARFINPAGGFPDAESVLRGMTLMAAAEVAAEPAVRAHVRDFYLVSHALVIIQ